MCINKETAVEGATLGRQKNGRTPTRKKKNKRGTRQMERKMEDDWRTRWRRRPPDVRNRITGGRGERRDARRSFSFGASFLAFSSSVLGLSHHPSLRDGVCAAGDGFFFAGFFFGVIILFILLSWLLFYRLRSTFLCRASLGVSSFGGNATHLFLWQVSMSPSIARVGAVWRRCRADLGDSKLI